MGVFDIWRNKQPIPIRGLANQGIGAPGASRPMQQLFRWLPNGQVILDSTDQESLLTNSYLSNHIVFTIVSWKAGKVSMARPLLYEKRDEKALKKYKSLSENPTYDNFMRAQDLKLKALVEVEIEGSDMMNLFENPNPIMGWKEFSFGHVVYSDLVGSSYWQGARAGSVNDSTVGKIKEMYLPPAHHVRINSGGIGRPIDKYSLTSNPDVFIDAANVWQTRNFSPIYTTDTQFLYGLSKMYAAKQILQKFNEGTVAELDLFQKKGIRQIVSPKNRDGNINLDTEGSYEQLQRTRDVWNQKVNESGPSSIMISESELTQITIGFTPEQLGLLDSQKLTKQDFCALWHVPANLFGWSEQKTYDNLPESRRIGLTDAVLPALDGIKRGINSWLLPSWYGDKHNLYVDFDLDVFPELQEDMDKKIKRMRESNCFTVNEFRIVQGYGAVKDENADKVLVSSGAKLLENLGLESFSGVGGESDPDLIDGDEEEDKPVK